MSPQQYPTSSRVYDKKNAPKYTSIAIIGDKFVCMDQDCPAAHFEYKIGRDWNRTACALRQHLLRHHNHRKFRKEKMDAYVKMGEVWTRVGGRELREWNENGDGLSLESFIAKQFDWSDHFKSVPRDLLDKQLDTFLGFMTENVSDVSMIERNMSGLLGFLKAESCWKLDTMMDEWSKVTDDAGQETCANFMAKWLEYVIKNLDELEVGREEDLEDLLYKWRRGCEGQKRIVALCALRMLDSISLDSNTKFILPVMWNLLTDESPMIRGMARQYCERFNKKRDRMNPTKIKPLNHAFLPYPFVEE